MTRYYTNNHSDGEDLLERAIHVEKDKNYYSLLGNSGCYSNIYYYLLSSPRNGRQNRIVLLFTFFCWSCNYFSRFLAYLFKKNEIGRKNGALLTFYTYFCRTLLC